MKSKSTLDFQNERQQEGTYGDELLGLLTVAMHTETYTHGMDVAWQ